MTAMQKLLIDGFVANPAVRRGDAGVDHESIMIRSFLAQSDLMTLQATQSLFRMGAHLELMHYRILGVSVALRALATGAHKCRAWLLDHGARTP